MKQLSVVLKDTATTTKFFKLENRTKKTQFTSIHDTLLRATLQDWE
jgi:hypothetical protein